MKIKNSFEIIEQLALLKKGTLEGEKQTNLLKELEVNSTLKYVLENYKVDDEQAYKELLQGFISGGFKSTSVQKKLNIPIQQLAAIVVFFLVLVSLILFVMVGQKEKPQKANFSTAPPLKEENKYRQADNITIKGNSLEFSDTISNLPKQEVLITNPTTNKKEQTVFVRQDSASQLPVKTIQPITDTTTNITPDTSKVKQKRGLIQNELNKIFKKDSLSKDS